MSSPCADSSTAARSRPAFKPRASPEPPAGAPGTGGAQGRAPDNHRGTASGRTATAAPASGRSTQAQRCGRVPDAECAKRAAGPDRQPGQTAPATADRARIPIVRRAGGPGAAAREGPAPLGGGPGHRAAHLPTCFMVSLCFRSSSNGGPPGDRAPRPRGNCVSMGGEQPPNIPPGERIFARGPQPPCARQGRSCRRRRQAEAAPQRIASRAHAGVAERAQRERHVAAVGILDIRTLFHHNADGLICPEKKSIV